MQELDGDALRELEPALSPKVVRGPPFPRRPDRHRFARPDLWPSWTPSWPAADRCKCRCPRLRTGQGGVSAVLTDTGPQPCDLVVLAAGAWSRDLARQLGDRIPVIAERGYHVMVPEPEVPLRIPVVAGEHNVSMVTMTTRPASTTLAEFAAIDAAPDHARAMGLFERAARMLRGVRMDVQSRWVGSRPSTPDSLPVIGRSPHARNVLYAFGHGHLGLTFGAVTGAS